MMDLLTRESQVSPSSLQGLLRLTAMGVGVEDYWSRFLLALSQVVPAETLLLLRAQPGLPWQAFEQWPVGTTSPRAAQEVVDQITQLSGRSDRDAAHWVWSDDGRPRSGAIELCQMPSSGERLLLIALLPESNHVPVETLNASLVLAVAVARERWERTEALAISNGAEPDSDTSLALYQLIRSGIRVSQQPRFLGAAFELCSVLAERFHASRVCLGWRDGPVVRLKAVSEMEKFDAKSTLARSAEAAMEEAIDQEAVILFPAPSSSPFVSKAHSAHTSLAGLSAVVSIPFGRGDALEGIVTLEHASGGPLTEGQVWEIRLLLDQVCQTLVDLHDRDRWFGVRLWAWARDGATKLAGPRQTGWKMAGALSALFLIFTLVMPWPYRVDAAIAVRSKDVLFMPAPFDGYLSGVQVEIGDRVQPGQLLVQLDTRDLELEAAMAEADRARYSSEVEKAMGTRQLAEMRIALARQQQAEAKLALVRHQIEQAKVVAPQEGVVVEGELKKNLGAPVRRGDLLLKLSQSTENYLELEVDQSDVHAVGPGTRGEFALVGRPDTKFQLKIDRIDPVAVTQEGRNVYLARAKPVDGFAAWWRPGMAGNAKLDAGEKSLLFVLTHRTVRFVREMFWI